MNRKDVFQLNLIQKIEAANSIAIAGHVRPDGDCVGSCMGLYNYIKDNNLFDYNDIYNVNIPKDPRGIIITCQGTPYFTDEFKPIGNDMYLQTGEMIPDEKPNDLSRDTVATANGYISITPITLSRLNKDAFTALKAKNL